MARKVEVKLIDDVDGGPAEESVSFGLDGTDYEIDLSAKHAKELRAALSKFVAVAQRLSHSRVTPTRGVARARGAAKTDGLQNQAIREWAQRKGIAIAPRGRISQAVLEQYQSEAGRTRVITKRGKA